MKLNIHEIEEGAKRLVYEEPTESLNALLVHGGVCDFEFHQNATVRLDYYRAGQELFFQGHIEGPVIGHCGRCLEEYPFQLAADLTVVLVPRPAVAKRAELSGDELDLSYYSGDVIDLGPLVDEQIILALPTRPLCSDTCAGLCPACGANRNQQACSCAPAADPRLAALSTMKIEH